ncbi:transcriptional regulator with XRE-family HTH domain [Saccharopolyspora lacisalsi]|uniref:Transcriptional regulator with XRE-family HTH domain n=1 Tax=Halosaccharopolyspora lacisalsi TaxID=1000566 RepID=A0A839E5B1_9PSEU|nr:helix-turn-helix transcriptional regulator [Halosaccharopolyspora lacisalsi]MBA8826917.1 transcriptional regulator with XRE-family HTH domain [Halosaccharopolyspora lacisalsi]
MVTSNSPTVLKRWIAFELRKLREANGLTRQQAAARLGKAPSQIGHIETMRNLPSAADLEVLLTWYGHPGRVEFFRELLKQAKKGRDWWSDFLDTAPEWFSLFLGLESSAVQIDSYDANVIPGILQTPDYAEAIVRGGEPTLDDASVKRRVELRLARQEILDRRQESPQVWSVLDEAALRRCVGTGQTMRTQLKRLLELAARPGVDIQVLPKESGPHPGMDGTFTILSFPAELVADPGVVYLQTLIAGVYYEEPSEIMKYRDSLARLRVQALSPEQSREMIFEVSEEL